MKRKIGPRYYGHKRVSNTDTFKRLKAKLGLTQETLAEKAGLELKTVQRAEQGLNITKRNAAAIAKALNQPANKLFADALTELAVDGPQIHSNRELELTAVERIAGSLLRHCKGGHASTIRLFGTADTYVMPEDLVIHYHHDQSYKIPDDLRHDAEIRIRGKKAEAKEKNKVFFNGPNVSLIHWTASPPENGAEARIERNTLELHLAPVGWFDFEGTNGLIAERLDPDRPETYEPWVNLRAMAHDFLPRHSRLSNMLCNTITIFTPDGQVGYGKRRGRQSTVPSMLSCAIAENVNRFFDETDRKDYKRLINSFAYSMKASDCPGNDYDPPAGWPHPGATVRRGINEESSQHMMDHVLDLGIKVTGIDFGLDILHPFLLWIVLVDLTAEEFMRECAIDPGKDSHEAEIKFVPADFEAAETKNLLVRKDWVPGGKASFVRALQLIDAVKTQKTMPATKAFDILAAAR